MLRMLGQQYNVAIKMAAYSRHMLKFEQMLARETGGSQPAGLFINCYILHQL
jgi:hypothetical protein